MLRVTVFIHFLSSNKENTHTSLKGYLNCLRKKVFFYLCLCTTWLTYFLLFAPNVFCGWGGQQNSDTEKIGCVSHLFNSLFAKVATSLK